MGTAALVRADATLRRAQRRRSYAPVVHDDAVLFRIPDEDEALSMVRLYQEVQRPRVGPGFLFDRTTKNWTLRFPRPGVDRMEYQFVLTHKAGGEEWIPDPGNPIRAAGPFGTKSVVEFPGYVTPAWTELDDVDPEAIAEHRIKSRTLRASLRILLWTSEGLDDDDPAPLLVAHDGPEYHELSSLLKLLHHKVVQHELPPMRAALVAPVERDQTYSASASYARALSYEILPAIERIAPMPHGRTMRVGMGASLGALAMLHVHRINPAVFGALFLQSGSYFRMRFDRQEAGFVRFGRISRFMGRVLTAEEWPHPIPVTMTCGRVEENLANNRATCEALRRQGYDVYLRENLDAHNWIGWRDTFDPHLISLLQRVWGTR
ncbi:MAG TPA: esterase [Actinomycetota bacterium]|nr:esterase [Actinomycetota bacterium]